MNDLYMDVEGLRNGDALRPERELSPAGKDYLGELLVKEEVFNELPPEMRNSYLDGLLLRIDELTGKTALSKEMILQEHVEPFLADELYAREKALYIEAVEALDREMLGMQCERPDAQVIRDGPINPERYFEAKPRILGLYKDPYDNAGDDRGGWSLPESLNSKTSLLEQSSKGRPTFKPMVAIANQIAHGKSYAEISADLNTPEMYDTFKSNTGYINVGKELINSTYSSGERTAELAVKNADILAKQIEVYKPDVVIGGNTLHHFVIDRGDSFSILGDTIPKENYREFGRTKVYFNEDRVYIDTYHPSRRESTMRTEDYCNQIADIVKNWKNQTL